MDLTGLGPDDLVPSGPVRARLQLWRDRGVGIPEMSNRTGLSVSTISAQMNGKGSRSTPADQCKVSTYRAVMSVRLTMDNVTMSTPVGVHRRLQGLAAKGYPTPFLAERLDTHRGNLWRLLSGESGKTHVTRKTFLRVAKLYRELELIDPVDRGVPAPLASRTRILAARRGYAPAHTWDPDTIDDPEAAPEWTGACGTPQGWAIHKREGIPYCSRCSGLAHAPRREPGASLKEMPEFDGRKLKRLRERRDIGLTELSRKCGVDKSTLMYWEAGRSTPSRRSGKLDVVLATLGASVNDILVLEGE